MTHHGQAIHGGRTRTQPVTQPVSIRLLARDAPVHTAVSGRHMTMTDVTERG